MVVSSPVPSFCTNTFFRTHIFIFGIVAFCIMFTYLARRDVWHMQMELGVIKTILVNLSAKQASEAMLENATGQSLENFNPLGNLETPVNLDPPANLENLEHAAHPSRKSKGGLNPPSAVGSADKDPAFCGARMFSSQVDTETALHVLGINVSMDDDCVIDNLGDEIRGMLLHIHDGERIVPDPTPSVTVEVLADDPPPTPSTSTATSAEREENLKGLKIEDLRKILRGMNLDTNGKKELLIQRIVGAK